jgi:hypothetical protein
VQLVQEAELPFPGIRAVRLNDAPADLDLESRGGCTRLPIQFALDEDRHLELELTG